MLEDKIKSHDKKGFDESFLKCDICHSQVKRKNLEKHKKKHQSVKLKKAIKENSKRASQPENKTSSAEYTTVEKTYYKCAKCKKLISESLTKEHLHKMHGIIVRNAEKNLFWYYESVVKTQKRKKAKPKTWLEKPKLAAEDSFNKNNKTSLVKCPDCNATLNSKNLGKHFRRVHGNVPPQLEKNLPLENSRFLGRRLEHERPEKDYSEDIFDRAIVYHGGAYGLGKNRRH